MPTPGPLPPPSSELHHAELPIIEISQPWFRSHAIDRSPIFYGRNARYRFDSPERKFRVLYIAEDPFGAFVETFGQLTTTVPYPRRITSGELSSRALSEIVCDRPLRLVDLTGPGLARIGADSRLFAGDHKDSQLWAHAIQAHPASVDGLLYPTRHDPTRRAAAVFNESLGWTTLSRTTWLSLGLVLRDVLNEYGFALIESHFVQPAVRKGPKQEVLF